MLDFTPVREKKQTLGEVVSGLTVTDLKALSNESIDTILGLIADCTDEDVVFQPVDPEAHDAAAANSDDTAIAWTLGHIIVHTTAGSEEGAFLAAEQARGVDFHGRSRYETPWETVTSIAQCRQRLEESRRMRLASLDMWPDKPNLDIIVEFGFLAGPINAVARFGLGLLHEQSHYAQIAEVVRQARMAAV